MSIAAFLNELFEHGRVKVPRPELTIPTADLQRAERVLREQSDVRRLEFPGSPPDLFVPAAIWAAVSYYRACQLAVYRDLDAGAIDELLGTECSVAETPLPSVSCPLSPVLLSAARHWSVDPVFCFLPDLVKHASAASQQDPLIEKLRGWACDWPLSSVGMAGVEARHEDEIASHAGLLQLYVDRILAKKDWSRLSHPAVREAVRRSLGAHDASWPEARKLLVPIQESNSSDESPHSTPP
jgi:hypothetical protein